MRPEQLEQMMCATFTEYITKTGTFISDSEHMDSRVGALTEGSALLITEDVGASSSS